VRPAPELGPHQREILAALARAGGALCAGVLVARVPATPRTVARSLMTLRAAGVVTVEGRGARLAPGDLVHLGADGLIGGRGRPDFVSAAFRNYKILVGGAVAERLRK
jgi:hypothetical protein